jgi:hypothetical protein
MSDSVLSAHLWGTTPGSLNGARYSTAYEEVAMLSFIIIISSSVSHLTTIFRMAIKYLFMANGGYDGGREASRRARSMLLMNKMTGSSLRFLIILVILSRRYPTLCATSSQTRA